MSLYMYFFDTVGALEYVRGQKTFGHFLYISSSWKLEMNTFFDSTNLWSVPKMRISIHFDKFFSPYAL